MWKCFIFQQNRVSEDVEHTAKQTALHTNTLLVIAHSGGVRVSFPAATNKAALSLQRMSQPLLPLWEICFAQRSWEHQNYIYDVLLCHVLCISSSYVVTQFNFIYESLIYIINVQLHCRCPDKQRAAALYKISVFVHNILSQRGAYVMHVSAESLHSAFRKSKLFWIQ